MSLSLNTTHKAPKRNAKIIIDADELLHLEGLAEGMTRRNPALADRLLDEIGRAQVVKPSKMPRNVVKMGSTVTYQDESTRQEKTVTLVYPEEADITQMRVSVTTPIGVALLGLAEGASFYWDTRRNQRRMLKIISVEQPSVAS